jgi:hypothetical protein
MSRVTATLADTLFDRALHGHEVPVMHGGDVVATRTVHHDMLGLHLLRMRDPLNYAPPGEASRWLAGRGLTPLPQRLDTPALPPAASDLCDVVQETSPDPTLATSDLCDLVQVSPDPSNRRKNGKPRRSAPAARAAKPPLGRLQRAGSEDGDRLRTAHRPRRGAVQAVEPDARPEPHEVPHHPDMLGRHESSL